MNVTTGFACLGLCLALVVPAFCVPPAALIGKWQSSADASGHSVIFEFKPDGTEALFYRKGKTVIPATYKSGKLLTLRYTVRGDRVTVLSHNHVIYECQFKVKGDTLTFTKVLLYQGRPPEPGMHGSTLTRYRG